MRNDQRRRFGSSTLEMTLVGIPLMFILISIFEIARGMWIYHSLAYAVKEGTRYAIVHGANCNPKVNPGNNCQVSVAQIAQVIQNAGAGLDPSVLQVEMQSINPADDTGSGVTLSSLLNNNSVFPTDPGNFAQNPITFTAQYPFQSAISMFWPGKGSGMTFGTFNFPATSQENVQF
jgi:Flp pilus assembly protein TadG